MSPLLVTRTQQSLHKPQLPARPILAVAAESSFEKVLFGETAAIVTACLLAIAMCDHLIAGYIDICVLSAAATLVESTHQEYHSEVTSNY